MTPRPNSHEHMRGERHTAASARAMVSTNERAAHLGTVQSLGASLHAPAPTCRWDDEARTWSALEGSSGAAAAARVWWRG